MKLKIELLRIVSFGSLGLLAIIYSISCTTISEKDEKRWNTILKYEDDVIAPIESIAKKLSVEEIKPFSNTKKNPIKERARISDIKDSELIPYIKESTWWKFDGWILDSKPNQIIKFLRLYNSYISSYTSIYIIPDKKPGTINKNKWPNIKKKIEFELNTSITELSYFSDELAKLVFSIQTKTDKTKKEWEIVEKITVTILRGYALANPENAAALNTLANVIESKNITDNDMKVFAQTISKGKVESSKDIKNRLTFIELLKTDPQYSKLVSAFSDEVNKKIKKKEKSTEVASKVLMQLYQIAKNSSSGDDDKSIYSKFKDQLTKSNSDKNDKELGFEEISN